MKILSAALIVSTGCFAAAKSQTNQFDSNSQIGVVVANSQGKLCLAIPDASLAEGSLIQIVSPQPAATRKRNRRGVGTIAWAGATPAVATALIGAQLPDTCSTGFFNEPDQPHDSFYSARLVTGKLPPDAVGIAVVGVKTAILVTGALASVDLNGNGRRAYFRMCTSREGLHLTVWSGIPLKSERLWRRYYYLGYDTPGTCTRRDAP